MISGFDRRYKFIQLLGKGSFGEVYKVRDKRDERTIALKIAKSNVKLLKNEFSTLTRLSHPNLVKVYEFGFWNNRFYFTMEYIEGQDILSYCRTKESMDFLPLVKGLLEGLKCIHANNLVHGDIKPSNILITKNEVKIIDFSLTSSSLLKNNIQGTIQGSIGYLPPEAIENFELTPSGDLYSIGVLLYEMYTGKSPFTAQTLLSLYQQQKQKQFTQPREINRQISTKIEKTILRLLEPFPQDRFENTEELINTLFSKMSQTFSLSFPFTGRKNIVNKIKKLLDKRKKHGLSAPSTVIIRGESGMGKTALLTELANDFSLKGVKILKEKVSHFDLPLFTILKELCITASPEILTRYSDIISSFYPKLSNLLPKQASHSINNPDFKQIIYFVNETITETKDFHVLFIDDLHIIKPENICFYRFLFDHLNERTIVLASINPNQSEKTIETHVQLELEGLSPDDLKKLTFLNFGEMAFIDKLNLKIYSLTRGNPLLIRKMLNALAAESVIEITDSGSRVDLRKLQKFNIGFDQYEKERFLKKLENFSQQSIHNLMLISVIGDILPEDKICRFFKDERFLIKALQKNILVKNAKGYRLARPIFKKFIYESIDVEKIISFHRKTAKVLEDHFPSKVKLIFFHYLKTKHKKKIENYYQKILKINNPRTLHYLLEGLPFLTNKKLREKALITIAGFYLLMGNFSNASLFFKKSLDIADNIAKKINILNELAWLNLERNEFNLAINYYHKALDLLENKNDPIYLDLVTGIGITYFHLGNRDDADSFLQKALKATRNISNYEQEARILQKLGLLQFYKGNSEKSVKLSEMAVKLFIKTGNKRGLLKTYNNLGSCYSYQHEYAKAMATYQKSIDLAKSMGFLNELPEVILNIAALHAFKGENAKALQIFRKGKSLISTDGKLLSYFHFNLGCINYYGGFYHTAKMDFKKALKIVEKSNERSFLPHIFYSLAAIYFHQGIYKSTFSQYNENLKRSRQEGYKLKEQEFKCLLMEVYHSIGSFKKARELAECLLRKNIDEIIKVTILRILDDSEQALKILEALDERIISISRIKAVLYFEIADDYLLSGEIIKAEKLWKIGKEIADRIKHRLPSSIALFLKGKILFAKRGLLGPEHSLFYFEEAKRHFDKMNIREFLWRTNFHLGTCKLALGEKEQAYFLFEQAINTLEEIRNNIGDEELVQCFDAHPERIEFFKFIENQ
ncbi:protein kinase [bacterium]|nr:protein kinase [bacterium]